MVHMNFVSKHFVASVRSFRILLAVFCSSIFFFCGALLLPQTLFAGETQVLSLDSSESVAEAFSHQVFPHLSPPKNVGINYAQSLRNALEAAGINMATPQYVVLVDRNPNVQAVFLYFGSSQSDWIFIGASPASTGLPGEFDHFETPLGVFDHSLANLDFRAEGTKNEFGFRGYGAKGMRIYDFGWVQSKQGWGKHSIGEMRLQMHATDPQLAEPLLGMPRSKGCIRIPATLNEFIDRYGLLDADYDLAITNGGHFWVLRPDRAPLKYAGRYLVVIDSGVVTRPYWATLPLPKKVNH